MDADLANELLNAARSLRQAIGSKEIVEVPRNTALGWVELLRQAAAHLAPHPQPGENRECAGED